MDRTTHQLVERLDRISTDLAQLRNDTKADLAQLREEMATKADLAQLHNDTKADLAQLREENRKEHLNLYATIREELASHMGAIEEMFRSQIQLVLEGQQQFVRRDELLDLLAQR
jgi:hypothetical protein